MLHVVIPCLASATASFIYIQRIENQSFYHHLQPYAELLFLSSISTLGGAFLYTKLIGQ
jgi:hypothetical protein